MLHFGNILVPAYGLAVAIALVCGVVLAVRCAWRLGLDTHAFWNMLLVGLLAALLGSRLQSLLYYLRDVFHAPSLLLPALVNRQGISWGGVLAALIAVAVYARILKRRGIKLPLLRSLDALVAPVLLAQAVLDGVSGAALWQVWYVPLELCALHLVACAFVFVWFEIGGAAPLRAGEWFGAFLILESVTLFIYVQAAQHLFVVVEPGFLGLGASSWVEIALVILGGAFWLDWSKLGQRSILSERNSIKKENHAL